MTIQISAAGTAAAAQGAQRAPHGPHGPGGPPPVSDDTASLLGLSKDDVQAKLKSGATLAGIAKEQGVSGEDLVASIKEDLKTHKPDGAPALSDTQATDIASAIAEGRRPEGPPPGGGGQGGGGFGRLGSTTDPSTTLKSVADLLGVSSDELLDQLVSGDMSSPGKLASAYSGASSASTTGMLVDRRA